MNNALIVLKLKALIAAGCLTIPGYVPLTVSSGSAVLTLDGTNGFYINGGTNLYSRSCSDADKDSSCLRERAKKLAKEADDADEKEEADKKCRKMGKVLNDLLDDAG